jgi:hypothetical protein
MTHAANDNADAPSAERPSRPDLAGPAQASRTVATAALLAAAAIGWTAFPLNTGRAGTKITLIVAIVTAILSIAQLAVIMVPSLRAPDFATLPERIAERLLSFIRALPWAEVLLVALLVLEALHGARPWHTGILGIAILGYLFAVHLAETGARPGVLRAQLPVIAAGIGLLALAIGAAALPGLPGGSVSTAVRAIAVAAAVVAAGLAIPVGGSRRRP